MFSYSYVVNNRTSVFDYKTHKMKILLLQRIIATVYLFMYQLFAASFAIDFCNIYSKNIL